MAMFEDDAGGFWIDFRNIFENAKNDKAKYLIVYNTICDDEWNLDISLSSHVLFEDSEAMPILKNIATSKPAEKNVLHVYDLSLPFDVARKTIDILPKEAVCEYHRLIQERDRLPAPKREVSGLARLIFSN